MNKDTVIFGLSHRDWLPHKCLSSLSRAKCRLSIMMHYREWFYTSGRNTTKFLYIRFIRYFQVGILGCTFSELQASSEIRLAVVWPCCHRSRETTGCTSNSRGGASFNYSNGEDDQWHRVWLVPSFVFIEYNILSLSNITNCALFRS